MGSFKKVNMKTIKEIKNGATLPLPIYVEKKYVISHKPNSMILATANSIEELKTSTNYWDDCYVNIRLYDIYMNDNTKIEEVSSV